MTERVVRETARCLCSLGVRQHRSHGLVEVLQGPHVMEEDTKHAATVMSQCSGGCWLAFPSPQQSKACCSSILVLPALFLSPEPGGCHTRLYHGCHHAWKPARLSAAVLAALHSTGAKHTAPMQSAPAAEGCKAVLPKFPPGTRSEGIVVPKALRSAVLQEMVRLPPPTVFCSSCWQAAAHSPVPNGSGQKGISQSQEGWQRMPTLPSFDCTPRGATQTAPKGTPCWNLPASRMCPVLKVCSQLSVNKHALWQGAWQHSAASLPRRVEAASYGGAKLRLLCREVQSVHTTNPEWGYARHGTAPQRSTAPAHGPAPKGPHQRAEPWGVGNPGVVQPSGGAGCAPRWGNARHAATPSPEPTARRAVSNGNVLNGHARERGAPRSSTAPLRPEGKPRHGVTARRTR